MSLDSRLWSICLVCVAVTQVGATDVRADVDVPSELQLARDYNAASQRLWTAEADLARLRLRQLKKLRELGHASWLEVAQAEVTVAQHLARQEVEQQMAEYLSRLSGHVSPHSARREIHAVRMVDPLSARLIGWFEAGSVAPEWAAEFLQQSEPPAEETVAAERRQSQEAQRRVNQLREAGYAEVCLELQRAQLERDVAAARAGLTELRYRQAQAEYDVHRAISNHGVQRSATGLNPVNVNSRSLSRATLDVVALEAKCDGPIQLAELMLEKNRQYLTAIKQLYENGHASQQELQTAQQAVTDAERQREDLMRRRDRLAERVAHHSPLTLGFVPAEPSSDVDPEAYWRQVEALAIQHPTVLRHLIELRRQRLTQQAERCALNAELDLAEALGTRLAASERESGEQDANDLDQRILRARIACVDQLDAVLAREELRFAQDLAPRLQGEWDDVPEWITLLAGRSALGRLVMCGILVRYPDRQPWPVVYLDTYGVIDPVSLCLTKTCDDDSMCHAKPEGASSRLHSSASRIDESWRFASIAPIRLPRSALVSQYDLQRICSYYCDVPGSVCPQDNLGPGRLYSSYAVPLSPSRDLLNYDYWFGIRTVNYALSHTGYRKYPGLNYPGIPIYEPVNRRVKQTMRYRPSFWFP